MAKQAFKCTFLVLVDSSEAFANDERVDDTPVTVEEVKEYLRDALQVDVDMEENGNPIGVLSVEVMHHELEPLSPEEFKQRYDRASHMSKLLCVRFEYDMNYTGGNYSGVGQFAYVPIILCKDGNYEEAFRQYTGIDPIHIINYSTDELFNEDGTPLEQ